MAKDFIREGTVVAFRQANYGSWWTVLLADDQERSIPIYAGADRDGYTVDIDNLIKVLKAIKKEESKA